MIKKIICFGFILIANVGCGMLPWDEVNGAKADGPAEQVPLPGKKIQRPEKAINKNGAQNIAVGPGGGLNTYTTLVQGKKFAESAHEEFDQIFDLFVGLSGGATAATLFMTQNTSQVLNHFKSQVNSAFPDIVRVGKSLIAQIVVLSIPGALGVLMDEDGSRRSAFNNSLLSTFGDLQFSKENRNKYILVASADRKLVCFADSSLNLPKSCTYSFGDGTRVADGVINSSNFQVPRSDITANWPQETEPFQHNIPEYTPLFRIQKMPDNKLDVVDGVMAEKDLLDGTSPLPVAVDYLLNIKTKGDAEHNIVVFDNGSSTIPSRSNQEYRNSIKMNEDGYARIEKNGVVINVFLLKISLDSAQFESWTMDKSDKHWSDTEALVDAQINGPRKEMFERAVNAVKINM